MLKPTAEDFAKRFAEEEFSHRRGGTNTEWTEHLSESAGAVAQEFGLYIATKAVPDSSSRSEYFSLDVVMLDKDRPKHKTPYGDYSFPMPAITMEFENDPKRLQYDYWKLLCVRSQLRVLTYVVRGEGQLVEKAEELAKMRGEHPNHEGEDLLLGGRFGMALDKTPWAVFAWRQDRFVQLGPPANIPGWKPVSTSRAT